MSRKRHPLDVDYLAKLYTSGIDAMELAQRFKVSDATIRRRLREASVPIRDKSEAAKGPRLNLPVDEIISRYVSGNSAISIAKSYNVTDRAIVERLKSAGIDLRTRSQASRIRFERETQDIKDRRSAIMSHVHSGRPKTEQMLQRRARGRTCLVGTGETDLVGALQRIGAEIDPQRPVGRYNIDVAIGDSIAVELIHGSTQHITTPRWQKKVEYLCDRGYRLIFVIYPFRRIDNLRETLDQVVANIRRISRSPSLSGKHWMIRCQSQRFTRGRRDLKKNPVIPPPIYSLDVREWNPS